MGDSAEKVLTRGEKAQLAESYLEAYPHFCASPVGQPRAEALAGDPVLGVDYRVIPFGRENETGWSLWFFPTAARRDAFVRRYRPARQIKSLRSVTGPRSG